VLHLPDVQAMLQQYHSSIQRLIAITSCQYILKNQNNDSNNIGHVHFDTTTCY